MDLSMEGRKGIKRKVISERESENNNSQNNLDVAQSVEYQQSAVPMNSGGKYRTTKVISLNEKVHELKKRKRQTEVPDNGEFPQDSQDPPPFVVPTPIDTNFVLKSIKRNAIDLNDKYEIIRELENGKTQTQVRKNWNLPQSTVATIWKKREQIKIAFDFKDGNVKKLKVPHHSSLEEKLLSWVELMNSRKIQLIGPLIQLKAKEIAEEEGILTFSASNGWLQKFKARHGIVFSAMNGGASMKWRSLSAQQSASLQRLAEIEPESLIIECEPMPSP